MGEAHTIRIQLWCALTETLAETLGCAPPPQGGVAYYGVGSRPPGPSGYAGYLVGVAGLESLKPAPPLVTQILPAGPYAGFQDPGDATAHRHLLAYLYHTWLPQSDYAPGPDFEVQAFGPHNPGMALSDGTYTHYIPLKPLSPSHPFPTTKNLKGAR